MLHLLLEAEELDQYDPAQRMISSELDKNMAAYVYRNGKSWHYSTWNTLYKSNKPKIYPVAFSSQDEATVAARTAIKQYDTSLERDRARTYFD